MYMYVYVYIYIYIYILPKYTEISTPPQRQLRFFKFRGTLNTVAEYIYIYIYMHTLVYTYETVLYFLCLESF